MSYAVRCDVCTRVIHPRGEGQPLFCAFCGARLSGRPTTAPDPARAAGKAHPETDELLRSSMNRPLSRSALHGLDHYRSVRVSTSTSAILSVILGAVGVVFFGVPGFIAIILGLFAKREIRDSGGAIGGAGLATTGIIFGWAAVGIWLLVCCGGIR